MIRFNDNDPRMFILHSQVQMMHQVVLLASLSIVLSSQFGEDRPQRFTSCAPGSFGVDCSGVCKCSWTQALSAILPDLRRGNGRLPLDAGGSINKERRGTALLWLYVVTNRCCNGIREAGGSGS